MKQILQNLSNGETILADVPCPKNIRNSVLIQTRKSIVSAGTERMLIDFGKAGYIDKARQHPDKVKMVLGKIKTDGLLTTIDSVRSKLDQPLPLGYCNTGIVIEGDGDFFKEGDRVVSNGSHAEVVRVPKNLCVKIPDNVNDESAAFTVLGAIGLQGIRLLQPTIGENFVVTGLGLIGLICVQILRANGCRVLGVDFDEKKCKLAREFGAETVNLTENEDPLSSSKIFSRGRGVDGVIITAASKSNEIMHQAANMCRQRGRIVLVGVVGLNLRRDDYYKKELSIQVSSSYGPGRYDPFYEEEGNDYPVGFVRWTEQRNFEAVLDMMSSKMIDLQPLISHRFEIENAIEAYSILNESSTLGIVLNYSNQNLKNITNPRVNLTKQDLIKTSPYKSIMGFIGAGNYASRTLIPAFKRTNAFLDTLVTSGGVSGIHHGAKNSFNTASTELNDLWCNKDINTVAIVTRHDLHASQVINALKSGKNVFVEKPLALSLNDLKLINETYLSVNKSKNVRLMVGFNRRFSPHIIKIRELLENFKSPKSVIITINSGAIPSDHWVQNKRIGGGRIIGEACHFIDLMRNIVGSKIVSFNAVKMKNTLQTEITEDKSSITLSFEDGSFGTIHYFSNGSSSFPKERVEVFCDNSILQLNNYRILTGFGFPKFNKMRLFTQDKGQNACAKAFIDSINAGKEAPIPYEEIMETSRIAIEVADSLANSV